MENLSVPSISLEVLGIEKENLLKAFISPCVPFRAFGVSYFLMHSQYLKEKNSTLARFLIINHMSVKVNLHASTLPAEVRCLQL